MKKSLSSSLNLVFWSFIICIFGTLLASSVYMVYSMCQNLVAGQTSTFSGVLFLKGLLVMCPLILEISCMFLVFYLIRHPSESYLPIIVYAVIGLLTWCLFLPFLFGIQNKYINSENLKEKKNLISSGYFRKAEGNQVLYYSKVMENGDVEGVLIDLGDGGKQVYTFNDASIQEQVDGFQDSIIKSSVKASNFMEKMIRLCSEMNKMVSSTASRGYLHWLTVVSLGMALLSVAGLRNLSEWRLLDVLLVFIVFFCVIACNILVNVPYGSFSVWVNKVNGAMTALKAFFNPFQIICNLVFSVIMIFVGVLLDRKDKASRKRNSL